MSNSTVCNYEVMKRNTFYEHMINGQMRSIMISGNHSKEYCREQLFRNKGFKRVISEDKEAFSDKQDGNDYIDFRYISGIDIPVEDIVAKLVRENNVVSLHPDVKEEWENNYGLNLVEIVTGDYPELVKEHFKDKKIVVMKNGDGKATSGKVDGKAAAKEAKPNNASPAQPLIHIPESAAPNVPLNPVSNGGDGELNVDLSKLAMTDHAGNSMFNNVVQTALTSDPTYQQNIQDFAGIISQAYGMPMDQALQYANQYIASNVMPQVINMVSQPGPVSEEDIIKSIMENPESYKELYKLQEALTPEVSGDEEVQEISGKDLLKRMIKIQETKKTKRSEIDFSKVVDNKATSDDKVVCFEEPEKDPLGDEPVDNSAIIAKYPILKEIATAIEKDNVFGVKFNEENGFIKAGVFAKEGTDDELQEKFSFVADLTGLTFGPGAKFWPGYTHETPVDFETPYFLNMDAITAYLEGTLEEQKDKFAAYGGNCAELNKVFDIRSIYEFTSKDDDIQGVLTNVSKVLLKPSTQIRKKLDKENAGFRFVMAKFTNKDTFVIECKEGIKKNVGGENIPFAANASLSFMTGKAPKLAN